MNGVYYEDRDKGICYGNKDKGGQLTCVEYEYTSSLSKASTSGSVISSSRGSPKC